MTINNREQIIEQLAEIFEAFDIDIKNEAHLPTDVYMYVNGQENGTLNTVVDVNGTIRLDDDYYMICTGIEYDVHFKEYSANYLERAEEIFEQFEESTVLL